MNSDLNLNDLTNIPSTNIDGESMLSMIGGKDNKNIYLVMSSQSAACSLSCTLSCTINSRCF